MLKRLCALISGAIQPERPAIYQVSYIEALDCLSSSGHLSVFTAASVKALNQGIAWVEMDGGCVVSVVDIAGHKLRPEDIKGCVTLLAW